MAEQQTSRRPIKFWGNLSIVLIYLFILFELLRWHMTGAAGLLTHPLTIAILWLIAMWRTLVSENAYVRVITGIYLGAAIVVLLDFFL